MGVVTTSKYASVIGGLLLCAGCAGGGVSTSGATEGEQGWPNAQPPQDDDDDDDSTTGRDDDRDDDDDSDDDNAGSTGDSRPDDSGDEGSTGDASETTGPMGPLPGQLRAFVTYNTVDGNFGGLWGGDEFCQTSADSVGLDGTFLAFLPWGDYPPEDAFADQEGPWVDLHGNVVFLNPAGLALDPLAPIAIDERGTEYDFKRTWTGSGSSDCDNWGTEASGMEGGTGFAGTSNPSMWKDGGTTSCDTEQSLYCLEYVAAE